MAGSLTAAALTEDTDYLLWLRYLELAGDRAMTPRLKAVRAAERAGLSALVLGDGRTTDAPLIVAAEAGAAAHEGRDETAWRRNWTRLLVRVAVTWREESTTQGVVSLLTLTDGIAADLNAAGAWPWPAPAGRSATRLTYAPGPGHGMEGVQGADYVVWHRLLEMSGAEAVAIRLGAMHAATQSGCSPAVQTADGRRLPFPAMIVAEGALAARERGSEQLWQEDWTRRIVRLVKRWPDAATVDAAAALMNCTPSVVRKLKYIRVWPWLGTGGRRESAGNSVRQPAG